MHFSCAIIENIDHSCGTKIKGVTDTFTNEIWDSLDAENKVSLYVTYTDLESGKEETRIINKNVK